VVGERGIKFSGGQRQRIALARALAQKPQILLLDEATSNLDSESESLIQKAISDLRGKITIIIVAHRLSTIMKSDRIIALKNGVIIENGSPHELLQNKNSYFYKIHSGTSNDFGMT
jgi:ABC-type multidrug transport system fused ATPase/permease subunit